VRSARRGKLCTLRSVRDGGRSKGRNRIGASIRRSLMRGAGPVPAETAQAYRVQQAWCRYIDQPYERKALMRTMHLALIIAAAVAAPAAADAGFFDRIQKEHGGTASSHHADPNDPMLKDMLKKTTRKVKLRKMEEQIKQMQDEAFRRYEQASSAAEQELKCRAGLC
jgi:hypothetical protein